MERTWKPTTAGILAIIAGAMGIGRGGFVIALAVTAGAFTTKLSDLISEWIGVFVPGAIDIPSVVMEAISITPTVLIVIGAVSLAFGIVALVGGIYAIRRRVWGLSLAGSILSLPSSVLLGILAIIFVSIGKREFA